MQCGLLMFWINETDTPKTICPNSRQQEQLQWRLTRELSVRITGYVCGYQWIELLSKCYWHCRNVRCHPACIRLGGFIWWFNGECRLPIRIIVVDLNYHGERGFGLFVQRFIYSATKETASKRVQLWASY